MLDSFLGWVHLVLEWFRHYKELLEIAVWIVGSFAVFYTAAQFVEAKKQRGLQETFDLSDRIDGCLAGWSAATRLGSSEIRQKLALLLMAYEIVCDAINRNYISGMAKETLSSQILDSIPMVFGDEATREQYEPLCHTAAICKSLKIFLLNHPREVRHLNDVEPALLTIFGRSEIFQSGVRFMLMRSRLRLRLRLVR